MLRLQVITIAPGCHTSACTAMTAAQGPAYSPVVLQAGEAAFETTGVTHWWRNETSEPVRALIVDIVEASTP